MSWIKRNLYFLIGSLVALALMGGGVYYLMEQISNQEKAADQLAAQQAELERLSRLNPHPGDSKIDNVRTAKDQDADLHSYIDKTRAYFSRPAPIPDSPHVINADFAAQLRNTVAQLNQAADRASVELPHDYYFSFEAQRQLMIFEPGSLDKLAVRLGEVKAICDILFAAKINALDGIQREVVSLNDDRNPPDYLPQRTVVTPLAEITPYQVSFRCFSTELSLVLAGLANSPHTFLVKTINVEPAAVAGPGQGGQAGSAAPAYVPYTPAPQMGYGGMGYGGYGGGYPARGGYPQPYGGAAAPAAAPAGPTTFLNERQLRVTLMIEVVKLVEAKGHQAAK